MASLEPKFVSAARTANEPGLAQLLGQLTEDAREVARAEIGLQKARVGEVVTRYRSAITFFAIAAVLGLAALPALFVGLIMTLATLIGPGLATLAVIVVVLALAGVFALVGKSRLRKPVA